MALCIQTGAFPDATIFLISAREIIFLNRSIMRMSYLMRSEQLRRKDYDNTMMCIWRGN